MSLVQDVGKESHVFSLSATQGSNDEGKKGEWGVWLTLTGAGCREEGSVLGDTKAGSVMSWGLDAVLSILETDT